MDGHVQQPPSHSHDDHSDYRFCPRCGGPLERRVLKATEPERLVCAACGFVFYLDPKIAVGTIIRTASTASCSFDGRSNRLRQVGVSRRLRRSRRTADDGGDPRSARGVRTRRPPRRPGEYLFVPEAGAGDRRLRGDGDRRRAVRATTRGSKQLSSTRDAIPWQELAFRSTEEGLRDYLAGLLHPIRL